MTRQDFPSDEIEDVTRIQLIVMEALGESLAARQQCAVRDTMFRRAGMMRLVHQGLFRRKMLRHFLDQLVEQQLDIQLALAAHDRVQQGIPQGEKVAMLSVDGRIAALVFLAPDELNKLALQNRLFLLRRLSTAADLPEAARDADVAGACSRRSHPPRPA